jgi:AcrR family transcriptional regulator
MTVPRGVKPKRPYDSPRRREQAAATREAILDAAQLLFERRGYAATSVAAIAKEAGVALKTVYAVFGTKRDVLIALRTRLVRGGGDPVPVAEQDWFRTMAAEPDPRERIRLFARGSAEIKKRAGTIVEIIRQAAPADPEIASLWDQFMRDFYENQQLVIEGLDQDGVLVPDADRATDILWTINHPNVYHLLVHGRGWTDAEYERWLDATLADQLLTDAGGFEKRPLGPS